MAVAAFVLSMPSFAATAANADLVAKGKYLASLGDCQACHTSLDANAQPFAGGRYIKTPFGDVSTPNITPDRDTGIGKWSDEEFYRAMHDGIGKGGIYLYPVMPFPWYTIVTREDVAAIKAYLFSLPPIHSVRPPNKLEFPYSVRQALIAWRTLFFKASAFRHNDAKTAEFNRGAYLVNGLAHCGECHDRHPIAGASRWDKALQGGVVDDWYAPDITADMRAGIGAWSDADIASFLKGGAAPGKGVALGPMAETVHSLRNATQGDLMAMATYLKSTPPASDADAKYSKYDGRSAAGAQNYLNYCASCHGVDGKGFPGTVPALDGNGAVQARGPQNVIRVVLGGLEASHGNAPMLAIGAGMTDQEIADVTNYVRQTWANDAPPTAQSGMVEAIRQETDTLMNAGPVHGCTSPALSPAAMSVSRAASGLKNNLTGMTDADMWQRAEAAVKTTRSAVPHARTQDIVNGLTGTYCAIVREDPVLDVNAKALKLGHFSQLVYTAAKSSEKH